MTSDHSRTRNRSRLSRAEIKAYEVRRADERRRLALHTNDDERDDNTDGTTYMMARDDEFGVIRSDLIRLGWIVGVLVVMLAAATVILS